MKIEVIGQPNKEDWEFVLIDAGNGVKRLAVF